MIKWLGIFTLAALFLGGCAPRTQSLHVSSQPLQVKVISWGELSHLPHPRAQFFEALKLTCKRVQNLGPYCEINSFEDLKKDFVLAKISSNGIMTGYYEPTLYGSKIKSERYKYPLYAQPEDLVRIELGDIYPKLINYRLQGKIEENRVATVLQEDLYCP